MRDAFAQEVKTLEPVVPREQDISTTQPLDYVSCFRITDVVAMLTIFLINQHVKMFVNQSRKSGSGV